MATPGKLIAVIANALEIPERTVIVHDRKLSEAGLRSKKGRGPSAAQVTYQDAAYLIIAVVASELIRDSAQTVSWYRDLVSDASVKNRMIPRLDDEFDRCIKSQWDDFRYIQHLHKLGGRHTFGNSLSALMKDVGGWPRHILSFSQVAVHFYQPIPHVRIEILYQDAEVGGFRQDVQYVEPFFIGFVGNAKNYRKATRYLTQKYGHLSDQRIRSRKSIDLDVLQSISDFFRSTENTVDE